MKAYVYWLHLAEHTDLRSQGYIGVTQDLDRRFHRHRHTNRVNPHLRSAFEKYGDKIQLSILTYNDEAYCYEKEISLRPTENMGWNISRGGDGGATNNGRDFSEEWRKNLSKAGKGRPSKRKGRKFGPQSSPAIRPKRGYGTFTGPHKSFTCPNCGFTGKNWGCMKRFHFENCKCV